MIKYSTYKDLVLAKAGGRGCNPHEIGGLLGHVNGTKLLISKRREKGIDTTGEEQHLIQRVKESMAEIGRQTGVWHDFDEITIG